MTTPTLAPESRLTGIAASMPSSDGYLRLAAFAVKHRVAAEVETRMPRRLFPNPVA